MFHGAPVCFRIDEVLDHDEYHTVYDGYHTKTTEMQKGLKRTIH